MSQDSVEVSARILLAFDISAFFQKKVLKKRYGKQKTNIWLKRARDVFKSLYPLVPDIGGKKNAFYYNLVLATFLMPMASIMKEERLSTREIGEFIFKLAETTYNTIPIPFRLVKRLSFFKEQNIEKWKLAAKESQLRRFPADWVSDFIEGGEDYLYGYDIRECAIHKFWCSQGLEKLVPYLCLTDWPKWKSMGMSVERTQTVANGQEVCNFRFCRQKKECPSGWPPESNSEWTGKFERNKQYET